MTMTPAITTTMNMATAMIMVMTTAMDRRR
jgi:hypothetical protein